MDKLKVTTQVDKNSDKRKHGTCGKTAGCLGSIGDIQEDILVEGELALSLINE